MSSRNSLVKTEMAAGVSRSEVLSRLPARVLVAVYPVSLSVRTSNGESCKASDSAVVEVVGVAGVAWPKSGRPYANASSVANVRRDRRFEFGVMIEKAKGLEGEGTGHTPPA